VVKNNESTIALPICPVVVNVVSVFMITSVNVLYNMRDCGYWRCPGCWGSRWLCDLLRTVRQPKVEEAKK